ncbi:MAG TPA: CHAT domain-containing protein, partial [Pyrinomonadaceae bacterium]|nr:CHAT domain-containing protein [Pyrinomonadaceae bacterium]
GNARFGPLAGTAVEAKMLAQMLPQARVLTGAQATEAALKHVNAPVMLHVATHGFFLPDAPVRVGHETRGLSLANTGAAQAANVAGSSVNPLLRSGLALAGANERADGAGEDGLLTALEAAGLDLWGTKLVVLSACETGLGDVLNGEGVYGLRRALVLAGAESQVMSLWQVSDEATRALMVEYYRRLQAGAGRAAALRQVQLQMLRSRGSRVSAPTRGLTDAINNASAAHDWHHPFYWASFIQSGAWQPLADAAHN